MSSFPRLVITTTAIPPEVIHPRSTEPGAKRPDTCTKGARSRMAKAKPGAHETTQLEAANPQAAVNTLCRNGGHTVQQRRTRSSATVDTVFRNGGHGVLLGGV
ncbi:hypothetical protein [Kibdelosporangium philippinense]|uniref:hypothetical protein n=1 Tax=Kibdelosporangium philippinense TaxID=211113 RepID=UPI0036125A2D